jgi:hypothetical protein
MTAHRPHATIPEASAGAARNEPLSIDEVMDRYRGEWVLMRVTEHDADGWPVRGYVTVHAPKQNDMLDEMERQPTAPEHARLPLYSFLAEPELYVDPADPEALRRFIAEQLGAGRVDRA